MHPGQIHLKHFKHNYRFISFKAGLGIWRWKRQQSFLIHSEHSQTDINQCITAGVSWAYNFTVLTQFIVLKKIYSTKNYNFLILKYLDESKLDLTDSVGNPSKQCWERGNGSSETQGLMGTTAAPWNWEWGKPQTFPAKRRLAVAVQLLIV